MKTFMLIALLVCLTSCATGPKVLVHPFEQPQRSVPAQDVDFFVDATEISQPFRVIAHLSVTGAEPVYFSARARTKIVDALRSKAGALGADAVVVTLDYGVGGEPVASTGMRGAESGREVLDAVAGGLLTSRIHTIKAMAIIYEPVRSK